MIWFVIFKLRIENVVGVVCVEGNSIFIIKFNDKFFLFL